MMLRGFVKFGISYVERRQKAEGGTCGSLRQDKGNECTKRADGDVMSQRRRCEQTRCRILEYLLNSGGRGNPRFRNTYRSRTSG